MLIDLKPFATTQEVINLLSCCLEEHDPSAAASIASFYVQKDALHLSGYTEKDQIIGVLGFAFKSPREILITHLAVNPDFRGKGIATAMIQNITEVHHLFGVGAEATERAKSFYERQHFECIPIADRENGEKHYSCYRKVD